MNVPAEIVEPVNTHDGVTVGTVTIPLVYEYEAAPNLDGQRFNVAIRPGAPTVTVDAGGDCDNCPGDVVLPVGVTISGERAEIGELACCSRCRPLAAA